MKAKHVTGIYAIKLRHTNRVYIGSSQNISVRWSQHKHALKKGIHQSPHLQRAWDKYGESKFDFTILEECPIDMLIAREQYYMDQCSERFNCAPAAGTRRGVPQSAESIKKTRQAHLGRKNTPETIAKMKVAQLGNQHCLGRVATPETKAKISAAHKGNQRRLGYVMPDDVKEKIRVAQAGRPLKESHVEAIKAAWVEIRKAETHCSKGHEYTEENSYLWKRRRVCRTCRNIATLAYYHRQKAVNITEVTLCVP